MAREEQRITAWISDGSAGSATPGERKNLIFQKLKVMVTMLYVLRPGDEGGKVE